jgi:sugar lactone lactonase YvrE
MPSDSVERLLGGIDRSLSPRPEFAEALLDRLLVELERETDRTVDASDRGQADTMSDGTERLPAFPRPGVPLPAWPGGPRRWERPLAFLATAAVVALTLVSSYLAFGPGRPGRLADNGAFLPAISGTPVTPATDEPPIAELLWAADGGPNVRLNAPTGAAIDPQGNLWITDGSNDRVVILAPGGRVLSPDGVVVEAWGTPGSGEGQFEFTCSSVVLAGIAFDATGNIYVADSGNHRIQKFSPDRTFLTSWGSEGTADGQFLCPLSLVIDEQGRVYVGDHTGGKIAVFDANGHLLATWTEEVDRPEQLALDGEGNLWVADASRRGVQKFSPDGELLAEWDTDQRPMGIAIDAEGRVFVSGQGARVQVFSPEGEFLGGWGSRGGDPGEFTEPAHLVLDGMGHIYTVDLFGDHVQKFRLLPPFGPG